MGASCQDLNTHRHHRPVSLGPVARIARHRWTWRALRRTSADLKFGCSSARSASTRKVGFTSHRPPQLAASASASLKFLTGSPPLACSSSVMVNLEVGGPNPADVDPWPTLSKSLFLRMRTIFQRLFHYAAIPAEYWLEIPPQETNCVH